MVCFYLFVLEYIYISFHKALYNILQLSSINLPKQNAWTCLFHSYRQAALESLAVPQADPVFYSWFV